MDDIEVQESLCFMGGIPIVTKFAFKPFASNIRHEAAAFFQQICQTSTLTMQIFVSCRGLNVIAQILEEDYRTEKDLVLVGVGAIWNVFNLQSSTPKNEFCRIFAKSGILEPLSKILQHVLDDADTGSEVNCGYIFIVFVGRWVCQGITCQSEYSETYSSQLDDTDDRVVQEFEEIIGWTASYYAQSNQKFEFGEQYPRDIGFCRDNRITRRLSHYKY